MLRQCMEKVREKKPLIHNITNYVTVNDVANIILAAGGSPIMADCEAEAAEITRLCGGLCINIGTLNERTIPAMLTSGKEAARLGRPWLLDPVGAGASRLRTQTARQLLTEAKPVVVRGNMSEIKALIDNDAHTQGVDVADADAVVEENLSVAVRFAKETAQNLQAVVAVTGAIDLVASAEKCYVIRNGCAIMGRVTGTGCQLSALAATYLAANPEHLLEATATAVMVMGAAGEIAAQRQNAADGNATYRNRLIDAVYNMEAATLERMAKYEIL